MVGKYKPIDYINLVDKQLLPLINSIFKDEEWIYQQDNASIHNAKIYQDYYRKNNLNISKWPPRSPDLNIVENVFSILSQEIYKKGKVYTKYEDSWNAIVLAFEKLDQQTIIKVYNSIKYRLNRSYWK